MALARTNPRPHRRSRGSAALLAVVLVFGAFLAVASGGAAAVSGLLYRWQSDSRQASLLAAFPGNAVLESENFRVHYDLASDAAWAPLVLDYAEAARDAVVARMGWVPPPVPDRKVPVLLYPDFTALTLQFGTGAGFRALGAYWCGVIQMVSPSRWLAEVPPPDAQRLLWTEGPLVHEYTHYLVDQWVPNGACPRWLAEGLAQHVEYRDTGYLWLEAGNTLTAPVDPNSLYRFADLERSFARLPNAAMAYRQAFLLVAFLDEAAGAGGLHLVINDLAAGTGFGQALDRVLRLTPQELEQAFRLWLDRNLARYSRLSGEEAHPS